MDAKENALWIIHFHSPDHVMTEPPSYNVWYRGCNHEDYEGGGHNVPVGTSWTDVWGTRWQKMLEGVMGFPVKHPITDVKSLKEYKWPDPDDERISGLIYELSDGAKDGNKFLLGSHRETLWEKAYMLAGMYTVITAFFSKPDFVRELFRHIMDFQLALAPALRQGWYRDGGSGRRPRDPNRSYSRTAHRRWFPRS